MRCDNADAGRLDSTTTRLGDCRLAALRPPPRSSIVEVQYLISSNISSVAPRHDAITGVWPLLSSFEASKPTTTYYSRVALCRTSRLSTSRVQNMSEKIYFCPLYLLSI